jgi:bacteriorhodopsin
MSAPTIAAVHSTQSSGSRWIWLLLGGLAAGQLFAFWLVCSHQVRKAEARNNEVVIQQMALSDCLQFIPGSTIASCAGRDPAVQPAQHTRTPTATGALPVSFSFGSR